ncbi:MAG: GMC family oxidoreductase [Deltaproteobacteria bacterium]|nr:GMC family oxidoreductase [Deltaproteobacteria bacterium]
MGPGSPRAPRSAFTVTATATATAEGPRARSSRMPAAWDALVVGAGAAGILAAERLAARGHRVLVLEAGPRLRPRGRTPDVDRRAWPYTTVGLSYDWYRVRAVAGRTLLWGGWSYRLPDTVLRRGGWPYGGEALAPYYVELERRLGVVEGQLDERYVAAARALDLTIVPKRGAVMARDAVWTPARSSMARRARVHTIGLSLEHSRRRAAVLRAFDLRTERVHALRARTFILAASPIETTRVLLESELGRAGAGIGRGLVDHMVASYVLVEPAPPPPREGRGPFPGAALVESFVNRGPDTARPYPGGFSIELSGPMPLEAVNLERMERGAEGSMRATLIHALGETFPCRRRFVDLDPARRDAAGRRVPRLHLAWARAERQLAADMRLACTQLADALAIPGSRVLRLADPLQPGAGHEAGTCAMGADARAPADAWGRLRALDNVWVADASALPTAGDRHPTLTALAHALRVADDVARHLAHASPA